MSGEREINQRDLRLRSKEIMDAVEGGRSYTVTRDGRGIAELIPLRPRRTFLPREEFLAGTLGPRPSDPDALRADLDAILDPEAEDPYAR